MKFLQLLFLKCNIKIILFLFLFIPFGESAHAQENMDWRAGTATINITPTQSMWLGGYASRQSPSKGVRQEVWIKAVALEDQNGQKGVMVSMDLIVIPKGPSDRIRDRLEKEFNLSRSQIILNVSHTHTGPEVRPDVWDLEVEERDKIVEFVRDLEDKVVELVGLAIQDLEPARLFSGNGLTRFQVNRRNNKENQLKSYTELHGPNDYTVPVIKVMDIENRMKAIMFGYSCHATVLSDHYFSGDYPGYAQDALEKTYPGVTALFFQGGGGDQNPLPRREPQLAEQYGRSLAAAVDRILKTDMKPLSSNLSVSYSEINIDMKDAPPKAAQLELIVAYDSNYPDYLKHRAGVILDKIKDGHEMPSAYPYPVQVWRMGDQAIFTLGGEIVIGYVIELKRIFGDDIFVFGYSNDVMGYIPTITVLREGGYEGNRSPYFTNPWEDNIEYLITKECQKLAKEVGINQDFGLNKK